MHFHYCDEVSYCLHQFNWVLIGVFKDYLGSGLKSVVLILVWSSSVFKPISTLVVVIPVLKPIPLVIPHVLLVTSVSIVVPVEILSILVIFIVACVSAIASEIWSRIIW